MTAQTGGNPYTTADWRGDVVVIGGGIVGLATAREILRRKPGTKLIVVDKEDRLAAHQTGHNSGVIHSGMYYVPGSLKARACVAGAAQLKAYCDEKGIPWDPCGKVIVATDASEIGRLEEIHRRGVANGVPGIRVIGADELREVEPHVVGVQALFSPATGIVDYVRVAEAYAEDIRALGGEVRTRHAVESIRRKGGEMRLVTTGGEIDARWVIACAGAWSDRVAQMTGAAKTPRIVPFRGDYYVLRPERRNLVRGNIYPVPDPRFPFLGVHFTPRMNGELWLGPNAVLAFSRAGYRFRDVQPTDLVDMFSYSGFLRFGKKHWRTGYDEMRRDLSKKRFLASLQKYIPELIEDDLQPGPSGVRAQALGPDGALVDDFVIDRGDGVLHVRNAPSPAATSSLQIGSMVADAFDEMVR